MSGHSHWAGIKHKKEAADQKRGQVFSKLLAAISAAAKSEPNPEFNPRLRAAIEKAKAEKVPQENIERAIKRVKDGQDIEELVLEAYGPGGAAILIETTTDNKNRTIAEVKKALGSTGGKWAEVGSVRWAFNPPSGESGWQPKFPHAIQEEDKKKLRLLVDALRNLDDVQGVYTNAQQ